MIETIANVALVSLLILFYVFLQITEYIHSSRLHSCNGIKLIKIQPRCRVPVNNLIYFTSLLYAYLLLIHIYVMYYNYIVLSWCMPMYGLLSINNLNWIYFECKQNNIYIWLCLSDSSLSMPNNGINLVRKNNLTLHFSKWNLGKIWTKKIWFLASVLDATLGDNVC